MRGMEKPSLRNDAVFLPFLWTGTCSETSKPPRFTKSGQEPGCCGELCVWRMPGMTMVGFIPLYGNRSKAEVKLTM
jgi:hypothetical protein